MSGAEAQPEPLRARVNAVWEPSRAQATRALAVVFGMWPLFAILLMMLAFAWGFAMFQSP